MWKHEATTVSIYFSFYVDFASCACISNIVTVAFTSQHQLGAQFLPHVLQFSPGVSQCGATWASLPCIIWHLLSCVQIFFSFPPPYYASVGFPFTPHAGGPDTCLRSGFTLTVKLPSSVIISQQSKSRQPFSHVLLLSCAECLFFFSFFLSLAPQSLILITYSMRHKLAGSDADQGSSAPLRLDGGSCCLSASLSGCDKETVIDAFPRLLDGSAEFPHALIMTHDGNPCHRAMIGNEDGWCLR